MSTLAANSIDVAREEVSILSGVNFSVEKGELVGLIGPNGAGKTTLLRALLGLVSIENGTITYNGSQVPRNKHQTLSQKVAYLEQSGASFWPLSVVNLVMLGRMPHLGQWRQPTESDWEIVYQAMETCDVAQFASRSINTLSGGERARALLARALATDPEILLADEPVAGLDPAHQLAVMDTLQKLANEGAGIVVVMHDLTLTTRYCDRVCLMFKGKVVADGTAREVLCESRLAEVYGIDAHFQESEHGVFIVPFRRSMNKV